MRVRSSPLVGHALSGGLHLGLLAAAALASPALGATSEASVRPDAPLMFFPVSADLALAEAELTFAAIDPSVAAGTSSDLVSPAVSELDGAEGSLGAFEGAGRIGELSFEGPSEALPDGAAPERGANASSCCFSVGPLKEPVGFPDGLSSRDLLAPDRETLSGDAESRASGPATGAGGTSRAGVGKGGHPPLCTPRAPSLVPRPPRRTATVATGPLGAPGLQRAAPDRHSRDSLPRAVQLPNLGAPECE